MEWVANQRRAAYVVHGQREPIHPVVVQGKSEYL